MRSTRFFLLARVLLLLTLTRWGGGVTSVILRQLSRRARITHDVRYTYIQLRRRRTLSHRTRITFENILRVARRRSDARRVALDEEARNKHATVRILCTVKMPC